MNYVNQFGSLFLEHDLSTVKKITRFTGEPIGGVFFLPVQFEFLGWSVYEKVFFLNIPSCNNAIVDFMCILKALFCGATMVIIHISDIKLVYRVKMTYS